MGFLSSNSFISTGFTSFSNFSRSRTAPFDFWAFFSGAASIFFSLASLSAIFFSSHGFRFNGFVRSSIDFLLVHRRVALLTNAHFAVALDLVSDARRFAARSADQLNIRDIDTALLLGDPALGL